MLVPRAATRAEGAEARAEGETTAVGPASGTAAGTTGTPASISTRGTARLGSTVGCGTQPASPQAESSDRKGCAGGRRECW